MTGKTPLNPRIAALTLVTFALGSAAFVFAGILEEMAADLRVTTSIAGQLHTAYMLTGALFGPVLAWRLGELDRRYIVLLGLSASLVLHIACALSPTFQVLLPLRALAGLTGAIAVPGAIVAAAALAPPERRGSAVAMVSAGITLAFVVGVPAGSVVGALFDWRATFIFAAALTTLALAGVAVFMPSVPPPPKPEGGRRLRLGPVWPLFMTSWLAFSANMTINLYIAPVVRVGAGVTGAGVGAFQFLIGLGSIAGLWLGARAADRGAAKGWLVQGFGIQVVAWSLHLMAVNHLVPAGLPSMALVGLALFIGAVALFSMTPVIQARLFTDTQGAPLAMSLNVSVVSMGHSTGAAIGGAALAAYGTWAIPGVALVISTAAAAAVALSYRPLTAALD